MPLFFRDANETKLKVDGVDARGANARGADARGSDTVGYDPPAAVASEQTPDNEAPNWTISSSEPSSDLEWHDEPPDAFAELVPARTTKHINWFLIVSTTIFLTPIVILAVLCATDSFTRNFVFARANEFMKNHTVAAQYFSNAIEIKPDVRALEARADCYDKLGDLNAELSDLRALVQTTGPKLASRSWLDSRRYLKLANLEVRLGKIDDAKKLFELYATIAPDKNSKSNSFSYYGQQAAYQILLLGDVSQSRAIADSLTPKPDPTSKEVSGSSTQTALQALQLRESGDETEALAKIKTLDGKDAWVFRDSRFRYNSKDEAVSWSLEALFCLDAKDATQARALLEKVEPELKGENATTPIVDVLKAWMLLEEGKLDDCLDQANKVLAKQDELEEEIEGLNLKAAVHLIRQNVFEKQNKLQAASRESELYKQSPVSGLVFVPLPYRPKLNEG